MEKLPLILVRCFQRRTSRNARYSLRAFARDLGLSHTYLIRLMAGNRRLSIVRANQVSERLRLDERENGEFIEAVLQSKRKGPPEK